ncbi:MAG: MCE family protein, partial [Alphaproteobacteria bacterium]|nr:MCE family protein [Alphaproteobacteria bacterium]
MPRRKSALLSSPRWWFAQCSLRWPSTPKRSGAVMSGFETDETERTDGNLPVAAIRTTRFGQIFIWLIPIVAAVISGWLLWERYYVTGPQIEIVFDEEVSVERGRTNLRYLGVAVGEVQKVELNEDLRSVTVTASLYKKYAGAFMREGTEYWIVEPQINFPNVSGLKYLVQGTHIEASPGSGKNLQRRFEALPGAPERIANPADKVVLLKSDDMESLSEGSLVLFRGVEVGRITNIHLGGDGTSAYAEAVIDPGYGDLVAPSSVFWTRKVFEASFDLFSGASVDVGSLGDFLRGNVSFFTPPKDVGSYVQDRSVFTLQASAWPHAPGTEPGFEIILRAETMNDVTKGARIVFRGAKIGEVEEIAVAESGRAVRAKATILPEFAYGAMQLTAHATTCSVSADDRVPCDHDGFYGDFP